MPDQNDIVYNQFVFDIFDAVFTPFFRDADSGTVESFVTNLISTISSTWSVLVVLSWFVTALLIVGIIYAYIRNNQYNEILAEMIATQEKLWAEAYQGASKNKRWEDVQAHIASDNPSQWRLAIIEADIMLGELLETVGYAGTTIGEKLKSASSSNFANLNQAWRAHLVRNQIAHEGADFVLTKKIAQDTVTQYRMVFEEFDLI